MSYQGNGTSPLLQAESLEIKAGSLSGAEFFFTAILGENNAFEAVFDVEGLAGNSAAVSNIEIYGSPVPLPAAGWLFISGLLSLLGLRLRATAREGTVA